MVRLGEGWPARQKSAGGKIAQGGSNMKHCKRGGKAGHDTYKAQE